jgi:hypothetical protein
LYSKLLSLKIYLFLSYKFKRFAVLNILSISHHKIAFFGIRMKQ